MSSPPEDRELRSWKEIAEFLGATVRTAQRYEHELGLPVRRLPGGKGRIWSTTSELQAWRDARSTANGKHAEAMPTPDIPSTISTRKFRLGWRHALTLAAVVCVAVLACWWAFFRHYPIPARCEIQASTLIVKDAFGQEIWRRTFSEHLTEYWKTVPRFAWIGDLEGDGRDEVVFNKLWYSEGISRSELVCFSARGDVKWSFTPGGKVVSRGNQYLTPYYHIFPFAVGPLDRRYKNTIVTVSLHDQHFPTQVALVSPEGELIREYWHSGYLSQLLLADVDQNGRDEICLGGVSNGYARATVVILDPENMGGSSVEENPDFALLGHGPGREVARLLFPRSCISTNKKTPHHYNDITALRVVQGRLLVDTAEALSPRLSAVLNYVLDQEFRTVEVRPSDNFRVVHAAMRADGTLDHDFDLNELQALYNVRVLRPGTASTREPAPTEGSRP